MYSMLSATMPSETHTHTHTHINPKLSEIVPFVLKYSVNSVGWSCENYEYKPKTITGNIRKV